MASRGDKQRRRKTGGTGTGGTETGGTDHGWNRSVGLSADLKLPEPAPLPDLPRANSSERWTVSSLQPEDLPGFTPLHAQGLGTTAEFAPGLDPTQEQRHDGQDESSRSNVPGGGDFDDNQTGRWESEPDPRAGPDVSNIPDAQLVGGRYKITADLGKGGMSSIHRVEHMALGKEFALKIVDRKHADNARVRKFFGREAKILSRLEHPNIVQVIDYGFDDRHGAFLVMERLEGESLFLRIQRDGALKRHQAVDIALQIAEALHYVHGQNVVHYDVKAENILLCPLPVSQRGHTLVKLIDFGLSRTEALGAKLAQSEVAGTPLYMAPEQINGDAPRPSMDIYSFGVVLYEMLTGRLPFQGTIHQVMLAHWEQEPPPPSTFTAEPLEELLEQLVLRALAKRPEDRQLSMGQFIYELRTVAEMSGMSQRRITPLKKPITGLDHPIVAGPVPVPRKSTMASPYPSVWIDPDGLIMQANRAFAKFVGKKTEVLVGTAMSQCRFSERFSQLTGWIEEVFESGRPIQQVLVIPSVDEGSTSVLLSLAPIQGSSRRVGAVFGIVIPMNAPD